MSVTSIYCSQIENSHSKDFSFLPCLTQGLILIGNYFSSRGEVVHGFINNQYT